MIALIRTEFVKATRRTRTLIIGALLVVLPALITVAVKAGRNRAGRDNTDGLFRIAQQSGLLVPAAVLGAMSGFLLIVIAGTFAGDTVAGDAAWGNLRYLLMRPVPRGKLLVAKTIVAGMLIWITTILVAVVGLIAGVILFGAHSVNIVSVTGGTANGFYLSSGALLLRLVIATAYVAFGYTALLAIGVLFSTLTDVAAGAIAAAVGVYIVSEILDAITAIGQIRYALPTHYLVAWQSMFTQNSYPHDMVVGIFVQIVYLVVFGTAAMLWFRRKDIRS